MQMLVSEMGLLDVKQDKLNVSFVVYNIMTGIISISILSH